MAEERQPQHGPQPHEQHPQPQGQPSTQALQRQGGAAQPGLARRGGGLSSLFTLDPFDMLRTSPLALMRRLTEDMEQWFEQFGLGRGGRGGALAGGGVYAPPVEVCEREGTFIVRADLPGLTKDDVRVDITDEAVLIEGERRAEHEERQGGLYHSERRYGLFRRQIPVPEGVNTEQATATFKDGVLEITMPAPHRQTRGRRIAIQEAPSSTASQAMSESAAPTASSTDGDHAQTAGEPAS
jgi:HSP20 family protein